MPQDFSDERRPKKRILLPAGWRSFKVLDCSQEVLSKKGNPQYIVTLFDVKTETEHEVYAVNVPKKRWFLKSLCEACAVPIDANGAFIFEPPSPPPIKEKDIMGLVELEDNNWIDRQGNEHNDKQHKITDFKKILYQD